MEVIIYIAIFIIGSFIGSFATLATYRIPIKEDILIKHSYCPVCKENLVLKDLIPIFSYIFLRGKCSHCGEKISIRYLVFEVVSGVLFLLFIVSFGVDFLNISIYDAIFLLLMMVFFITFLLLAGIDKEKKYVDKSVLLFYIVLTIAYNIYLFFSGLFGYYTLIITVMAIVFYLVNLYLIKNEKSNYLINFIIIMLLSKTLANCYIVLFALFLMLVTSLLHKVFVKTKPPMVCYYIIYFISIVIGCNFLV